MYTTAQQEHIRDIIGELVTFLSGKAEPGTEYICYYQVDLSELVHVPPVSLDAELRFTHVLCENGHVLLAAGPYIAGSLENAPAAALDALWRSGLPLMKDSLVQYSWLDTGRLCQALLESPIRSLWDHPAWSYRPVEIPESLWDLLTRKGMLTETPEDIQLTRSGSQYGLCWLERLGAAEEDAWSLSCPPGLWHGLWHPEFSPPEWEALPLNVRIERIKTFGGANPGHFMFALQQLMDMPLQEYLDLPLRLYPEYYWSSSPGPNKNRRFLENSTETLQEGLGDLSLTYVQAARKIDRMLSAPETRDAGRRLLYALVTPISNAYSFSLFEARRARSE